MHKLKPQVKLDLSDRQRIIALEQRLGRGAAARALGISPETIDSLVGGYGKPARESTLARVRERLPTAEALPPRKGRG